LQPPLLSKVPILLLYEPQLVMRLDLLIDPIEGHLASAYSPEAALHLVVELSLAGAHQVGLLGAGPDLGLELGDLVILLVCRVL